jgi:hypothetical protein
LKTARLRELRLAQQAEADKSLARDPEKSAPVFLTITR